MIKISFLNTNQSHIHCFVFIKWKMVALQQWLTTKTVKKLTRESFNINNLGLSFFCSTDNKMYHETGLCFQVSSFKKKGTRNGALYEYKVARFIFNFRMHTGTARFLNSALF